MSAVCLCRPPVDFVSVRVVARCKRKSGSLPDELALPAVPARGTTIRIFFGYNPFRGGNPKGTCLRKVDREHETKIAFRPHPENRWNYDRRSRRLATQGGMGELPFQASTHPPRESVYLPPWPISVARENRVSYVWRSPFWAYLLPGTQLVSFSLQLLAPTNTSLPFERSESLRRCRFVRRCTRSL